MAITKTNFVEYTRCPRYSALENIRKDKLSSEMTIDEYKKEEESLEIRELVSNMFDEESDTDLTQKEDIQLNAMPCSEQRVTTQEQHTKPAQKTSRHISMRTKRK